MSRAIPNRLSCTLCIDETLHAKAKIIAAKEKRPLNSQFEYYIQCGVEQYEKEHGEVEIPEEE